MERNANGNKNKNRSKTKKSNHSNKQINTKNKTKHSKPSSLDILKVEGPKYKNNRESFYKILKRYNVDKDRFLQNILREQKLLLKKQEFEKYYEKPVDISNFLNTLGSFYKKQDIVKALAALNEQKSSQEEPFKNLDEYLICLSEQIKKQIDNFSIVSLANTLNYLINMFLSDEETEETKSTIINCINSSLLTKVDELYRSFNIDIDGLEEILLNSEASNKKHSRNKLNKLDEDLKKLEDQLNLKDINSKTENNSVETIKKRINKIKIASNKTKYTLKRNLFFLKNVLEIPIEDLGFLKEILKEKIPLNEQHKATSLENDIKGFLKNNKDVTKDSIKEEKSIEYIDNNFDYGHPIDFTFEYKGKTIYCEADGPTHFLNSEQIEDNKTPQTKIRDKINKFIVSEMNKEKQIGEKDYIYYITVPASECKNKEMFFDYLDGELELEIAKTSSLLQKESEKIIRILEGNNPNKTNSLPSLNSHVDTGQNTPEYPIGETIKKAMEEITNDKRLKRTQSHPIKLS